MCMKDKLEMLHLRMFFEMPYTTIWAGGDGILFGYSHFGKGISTDEIAYPEHGISHKRKKLDGPPE